MSLSIGTLLAILGGSAAADGILSGANMIYNTHEAQKSRDWSSAEAEIQREWQSNANRIAMDFNREQLEAQRAWETEMSNTAMQRQVQDLRKAGLNPVLAYSQLGGASTPAVSAGSGAANSATGAPSGSTAHNNFNPQSFTKMVEGYLHSAHEVSMAADRFQHEREMQELRQAHQERMYKAHGNSTFDTDEFYRAALERSARW